ncbi:MAG: hypothetical protein KKB20_11675 [Proteobacteria bacterium]|nr:hypothetical protein [Pseudomonadota bacterium]
MTEAWRVKHACPQCGGPVDLGETDRLFACPYCRVRFYMTSQDADRFYIVPPDPDAETLFFAPYWRFRGYVLACVPYEGKETFMDATIRAVASDRLPLSLGLTTQTQTLRYLSPDTPGRFLELELSLDDALPVMEDRARIMEETFHKNYFGEAVSLIYAPFLEARDGTIVDPIRKKSLGPEDHPRSYIGNPGWEVRFVPALCPGCGWDMDGPRNALALFCRNCRRAWAAGPDGFAELEYYVRQAEEAAAQYLPFWRLEAEIEGFDLRSYADLVAAANLPKVIKPEWNDRPFYFWTPAFKLPGPLFKRLARNATMAQPRAEDRSAEVTAPLQPVTLSSHEAAAIMKSLLAEIASAKRKVLPKLPDIQVTLRRTRLAYFPFQAVGNELYNSDMQLTVNQGLVG